MYFACTAWNPNQRSNPLSHVHKTPLPRQSQTANMVAQSAEFKKAVEDSRKLKAKPSDNELLEVYTTSTTLLTIRRCQERMLT